MKEYVLSYYDILSYCDETETIIMKTEPFRYQPIAWEKHFSYDYVDGCITVAYLNQFIGNIEVSNFGEAALDNGKNSQTITTTAYNQKKRLLTIKYPTDVYNTGGGGKYVTSKVIFQIPEPIGLEFDKVYDMYKKQNKLLAQAKSEIAKKYRRIHDPLVGKNKWKTTTYNEMLLDPKSLLNKWLKMGLYKAHFMSY